MTDEKKTCDCGQKFYTIHFDFTATEKQVQRLNAKKDWLHQEISSVILQALGSGLDIVDPGFFLSTFVEERE